MSCVFRFEREGFDAAEYLQKNLLSPAPYLEWEKEFCVAASDADFYNFEIQKQDVTTFLRANFAVLQLLIGECQECAGLGFAVADLISEGEAACQSERFELELLKLAGNLAITLEITRYPLAPDEEK